MSAAQETGIATLIPAILKSVDQALAVELGPEISSASGNTTLDMIRRLLQWSCTQLEQHTSLYQSRSQATAMVAGHPPMVADTGTLSSGLYPRPTPSEQRYFREAARTTATLQRRLTQAAQLGRQSPSLAAELEQLIACERRYHVALDPESAHDISAAYQGGKSTDKHIIEPNVAPMTLDSLNAYLRCRFPENSRIAATRLRGQPGGLGKETLLFELSGHPTFSGPLVMRKDMPELSLDVSAVDEFPLLQAAHAAGVRVPEPLWAETNPVALGTRFVVMRQAPGTVAIAQDIADENTRRHFADRLAEGLASIHKLRVPQSSLFRSVAGLRMPEVLRKQLAYWETFWESKRLEPSVKMAVAFAWLQSNVPPDPGIEPSLVHGDYGFHNLIMDHGEITAILDWEFAHMGDPAEDVNLCRMFVERFVSFDYFLERYLAHGGFPYDEARDRYFTVFRNLRNACACVGATSAFARSSPGSVKLATAAVAYEARFELEALRLVIGNLQRGS